MDLQALLWTVLRSGQFRTVAGLILLDVALGMLAALRNGRFDLAKTAQFYKTMVLPYLLGYPVSVVAVKLIVPDLAGSLGDVVGEGLIAAMWGAIILNLGKSIATNLRGLALRGK